MTRGKKKVLAWIKMARKSIFFKNWNESILQVKWFVKGNHSYAPLHLQETWFWPLSHHSGIALLFMALHSIYTNLRTFTEHLLQLKEKIKCEKRCLKKKQRSFFLCLPFLSFLPAFHSPALLPALLPFLGLPMLNVSLLNSHPETWTCKGMFQLAYNKKLQRKTALIHFTKHGTKWEKHAHF